MATRRKQSQVSKAVPRKFEGIADLLSKLEVETEKVVRRFVERAEQSSREIKKGIATIIDQVRSQGFASVASGKTEDVRKMVEDVLARVKEMQILPNHINRDEIVREARKNLDDLIDRISASDLFARAKATALNTKDTVLSLLSIPNQNEVVKLSRKITHLEGRVNKLTKKAA